ncbi:outer membrane protein OprF [Arcticibacter svalbardensis MN12-7]|uniref:Outer membrane protein OprF n=1 Tax=Arcticibacter svalbardensis MN12-7 TaxID=1150600 RepID=R9GTJ1_9SPHI|nr:OmpA family protein [Arcticibacter svalbardensis]EOR95036.1 outer membrane protein OprF [Arcticibacter svalbardensis MN12-7]
MIKNTWILVLIVAFGSFSSCKSKKALVSMPVSTSSSDSDAEYDAYRNKLPDTKIDRVQSGLKVTFDSEILFPINSSYLTEPAKAKLSSLLEMIKQKGHTNLSIEGHTDKTGPPDYNKWLSEKRALSVKAFAVSLGLSDVAISTVGYGDTKPVADNSTPEGRAKNRRVEIIISKAK